MEMRKWQRRYTNDGTRKQGGNGQNQKYKADVSDEHREGKRGKSEKKER